MQFTDESRVDNTKKIEKQKKQKKSETQKIMTNGESVAPFIIFYSLRHSS